jgi:hypothetical protein
MKKILIPILIVAFILTTSLSVMQVIGYEGSDNEETENTSNTKENYFAYININDKGNAKIGPFEKDETIFLAAQKIEGYEFLNWEIDGEIFTEDKEINIKIDKENMKIKANYYDLAKEVDKLIEKADEEILDKNYNKAQEYLLEAINNKNIKKSKYYDNLKHFIYSPYRDLEEEIDLFTRENIMTVKDYQKNIEKYQEKKPEGPKVEILERSQERISDWFYKCLFYTKRIRRDSLKYFDFAELEVDDVIREIESEYFVSPEGSYWSFIKGKLNNSEIYSISRKPEYDMPEDEIIIMMYLDLKEVKVEEHKVVISLEKLSGYPPLSYYNTGGNPYIKSCDIVFKIKKFENGTFKIKDYYIDNMITEVYQKEV